MNAQIIPQICPKNVFGRFLGSFWEISGKEKMNAEEEF